MVWQPYLNPLVILVMQSVLPCSRRFYHIHPRTSCLLIIAVLDQCISHFHYYSYSTERKRSIARKGGALSKSARLHCWTDVSRFMLVGGNRSRSSDEKPPISHRKHLIFLPIINVLNPQMSLGLVPRQIIFTGVTLLLCLICYSNLLLQFLPRTKNMHQVDWRL